MRPHLYLFHHHCVAPDTGPRAQYTPLVENGLPLHTGPGRQDGAVQGGPVPDAGPLDHRFLHQREAAHPAARTQHRVGPQQRALPHTDIRANIAGRNDLDRWRKGGGRPDPRSRLGGGQFQCHPPGQGVGRDDQIGGAVPHIPAVTLRRVAVEVLPRREQGGKEISDKIPGLSGGHLVHCPAG